MYIRDAKKHFNGNIPSDEKLEELVRNEDHRVEPAEDEDSYGNYIHIHWACDTCAAESILNHRRYLHESTLPGHVPAFKTASSRNINITELRRGMFADHSPYPGSTRSWSVECVSVSVCDDGFAVAWRKTNTDDEPFTVIYPDDAQFSLRILEGLTPLDETEKAA